MASGNNSWMNKAQASNKTERKRVAKKYSSLQTVGDDADPFMENDPILDEYDPGRKHDPKQYAKAAALPLKRAKKILAESEK